MSGMLRVVTGKLKELASDIVTVRTGTVVSDFASMTTTLVVLDNDPESATVQALALNGPLPTNTRVMLIAYPPRGLAIIGAMTSADTGWIDATYQNGWTTYPGLTAAAYRRIGQQVYLRGIVLAGTYSVPIFTLPTGFTPAVLQIVNAPIQGTNTGAATAGTAHTHLVSQHTVRLDISTVGAVVLNSFVNPPAGQHVSLDGVMFFVD